MPRRMRFLCQNGYMHLILRGVGRQILFEDRKDYLYFLSILERYSKETEIRIIAYCLMENHVHLLIADKDGKTSLFMKKVEVSYAQYYNNKYGRVGHLFQNRYMNENIYNEKSLLAVFRYILNNPVKAGICPASLYEWSSYEFYDLEDTFVDTSVIRGLIGDFYQMDSFLKEGKEDRCMDVNGANFHNDDWAQEVIRKKLGVDTGTALKSLKKNERDELLRFLKEEGLTVRQIERLTGISRSVAHRA